MNELARWALPTRLLHWLAAAAILLLFALGFVMVNFVTAPGPKFDLYQLHKSIGLLVLALMFIRIGCRFAYLAPPPIMTISHWPDRVAGCMHVLLYGLTIALALVGYASVSTSPLRLSVALPFGFHAPNLLTSNFESSEQFREAHHVLAALLALCVAGHVAAALKRRLLNRDGTLRRIGLF
jgi:cytochrome b561